MKMSIFLCFFSEAILPTYSEQEVPGQRYVHFLSFKEQSTTFVSR